MALNRVAESSSFLLRSMTYWYCQVPHYSPTYSPLCVPRLSDLRITTLRFLSLSSGYRLTAYAYSSHEQFKYFFFQRVNLYTYHWRRVWKFSWDTKESLCLPLATNLTILELFLSASFVDMVEDKKGNRKNLTCTQLLTVVQSDSHWHA